MKVGIIMTILFFPLIGLTQTREIEMKNITNKYILKENYSQERLKELGHKWNELLEIYGGYPKLPYDSVLDKMNYEFIYSFESLNKETIFNRIMEWSAINFGSIRDVIKYSNLESGKIILKGSFDFIHDYDYNNFWGAEREGTTLKTCYYTYTFTISDNKVKFNVSQINYEYSIYDFTGGYISTRKYVKPISVLYPITNYEVEEWKGCLDILFETNNSIRFIQLSVVSYIEDAVNDYNF